MSKPPIFIASACVALGLMWHEGPAAKAQNTQAYRDCSLLVQGVDPDFVELFGTTLSPQGTLVVAGGQPSVELEASESADPGDSAGHVTLSATLTSPGNPSTTATGAATGRVLMTLPLANATGGRSYTISWSATFDNGNHHCPSAITPQNTKPKPFVVTVS